MSLARTTEEINAIEYNYFFILKLDAKETDESVIRRALNRESRLWTAGHRLSRRYCKLIDDIVQVMINDVELDEYGCYTQKGARQREADRFLRGKIEFIKEVFVDLSKRGFLLKSEILSVAKREKVDSEDIEQALFADAKLDVRYVDDRQARIPFCELISIDKHLSSLMFDDIYGWLNIPEESTTDILLDAIHDKTLSVSGTNFKAELERMLCSLFLNVVRKEEGRIKYDEYRAIRNDVWHKLDMRSSLGLRYISVARFREFVDLIMTRLGKSREEAELDILADLCHYRFVVETTDGGHTSECPLLRAIR